MTQNTMKSLYSYDDVEILSTGRNYDFIVAIVNNNPQTIVVTDLKEELDDIIVPAGDWIGLLNDYDGREWLSRFENIEFRVV